GVQLEPDDSAVGSVRLGHGAIEDLLRRAPDVGPGAVTFDERDDWIARYLELAVAHRNRLAFGRGPELFVRGCGKDGHTSASESGRCLIGLSWPPSYERQRTPRAGYGRYMCV